MALEEALKKATIEDLKDIRISFLNVYARQNQEALKFLYDKGIIDDESIEKALEVAVVTEARRDYEHVTREGSRIKPDHLGRPECLAYALEKGIFTKNAIENIPFDHGETAETFPEEYNTKNLLSNLRDELLNPKDSPKFDGYIDPHPVPHNG